MHVGLAAWRAGLRVRRGPGRLAGLLETLEDEAVGEAALVAAAAAAAQRAGGSAPLSGTAAVAAGQRKGFHESDQEALYMRVRGLGWVPGAKRHGEGFGAAQGSGALRGAGGGRMLGEVGAKSCERQEETRAVDAAQWSGCRACKACSKTTRLIHNPDTPWRDAGYPGAPREGQES